MQNISLQKFILYTILHCILFCIMAGGCEWCTPGDKSTTITPPSIPTPTTNKTEDKTQLNPANPIQEGVLDDNDKDKKGKKKKNEEEEEEEEEDDDDDDDDDDDEEEEEEEKKVEKMLNTIEDLLKKEGNPDEDSGQKNPEPSAPPPPMPDREGTTYSGDPPPPYQREWYDDYLDKNAKKSSTTYNIWKKFMQLFKKIRPKDKPGLLQKVQKFQTKISSFLKATKELQAAINQSNEKINKYKQVQALRKKHASGPELPDIKDQALLVEYERTSDEGIELKIKKKILKNIIREKVIQGREQKEAKKNETEESKKQKKEKRITNLTKRLRQNENKKETLREVQKIRSRQNSYSYSLFNSNNNNIAAIAHCEHLTIEAMKEQINKWKPLYEQYKDVSDKEIEKKINDLEKLSEQINTKLKKLKPE